MKGGEEPLAIIDRHCNKMEEVDHSLDLMSTPRNPQMRKIKDG